MVRRPVRRRWEMAGMQMCGPTWMMINGNRSRRPLENATDVASRPRDKLG